jgi:hypothetical protein
LVTADLNYGVFCKHFFYNFDQKYLLFFPQNLWIT